MRLGRSTAAAAVFATLVGTVVGGLATSASAVQYPQSGIVTDNPVDYTPNLIDGKVETIAQVGNTILIGGTFTQIQEVGTNKPVLTRTEIAAFDATTGVVLPSFAPTLDGEVTTILPAGDGASVFVAGYFNTVNGVTTRKITKLNVSTGAKVAGFVPAVPNSNVQDLRLVRGQLIVAGAFTAMGATPRGQLASINPTTGALTSFMAHTFAGPHNNGVLVVSKIDATPDGSKVLGLGNFTTVDGLARDLLFLLDTSGTTSVVSTWQTNFFAPGCSASFASYMRDLDISPDGSYGVVSTTGAYGGSTSPCDSVTRWDLTTSTPDQKPVWQDMTGGDTTYAVAVTNAAVYVGGHMRWENNPLAGDSQGPGGVPREGIAALDPATGLPLSWNPGRTRGVGVFDMLATSTGLWVGSDTDAFAGEVHKKLAYLPLAGGITPPANLVGTLANDVYLLGNPAAAVDQSVLYRINAAGPTLASTDDGPDWAADNSDPSPYRNTGSNATGWSPSVTLDSTVPNSPTDRAPIALFDSERWDPGSANDGNEMQWHFPVAAGTHITVRLYMANRYSGTASAGQRVFSVVADGSTVFPNIDLSGTVGQNVGTMKSFSETSDGSVDLTFLHQIENPLINGIEIINNDVPTGPGAAADGVRRDFVTTTGAPSNPGTVATVETWGQARGSFLVDGTVYSGWADGTFRALPFDGTTFGASTSIPLYANTFGSDIPAITGLAYLNNRIYYTLVGDDNLYWRWFTPQSQVVGALRYTVSNAVAFSPSRVSGLFASGSSLYFADKATGNLYSVALTGTGGATFQPGTITGPATLLDSSMDWRARGAFVWNGTPTPRPNVLPTAVATGSCSVNVCSLDGSGSSDSDGSIVTYAWDFGDGTQGTGAVLSHAYTVGGPYTATLTVTDDRGGTATAQVALNPTSPPNQPPVASFTTTCTQLSCTFNGSGSTDPDGSVTGYAWSFSDGGTATGATTTYVFGAAGTYTVALTVTDNQGATGNSSTPVTVTAVVPANIAFRVGATASVSSATARITIPASVQAGDALLLFVTSNSNAAVTSDPAGWTFVGERTSGAPDMRTRLYRKIAAANDAATTATVVYAAANKVDLQVAAYTGVDPTTPISVAASLGETTSRAAHTTPGATVGAAGSWVVSYWADKSSATTGWTAPAGQTTRAQSVGSGAGLVTSLLVDSGAGTASGAQAGLTATASSASAKATMWTVVLAPAGALPPTNQPPVASFTSNCTGLVCSFDGSGSSDPDGTVVGYAWDFGDTTSASTTTVTHTFGAAGTYTVVLKVTDNSGADNSKPVNVTVAPVAAPQIAFRAAAAVQVNATTQQITVPAAVQAGDVMLLFASSNSSAAITSPPVGWAQIGAQTAAATDLSTVVFQKVATAGDVGSQVSLTYAAVSKVDLSLAAYSGVDVTTPVSAVASAGESVSRAAHTTPGATVGDAGSWVLSYWADKSAATTTWATPAGQTLRSLSVGINSGHVTSLLTDTGVPVAVGASAGVTATADSASAKATMWTIVLKVGS